MEGYTDLNRYDIPITSNLMFDTNIWIYLFDLNGSSHDPGYGNILSDIIKKGATIYTCPSIISEYINTSVRTAGKAYFNGEPFNFKKDYRPTDEFKSSYDFAIQTVKEDILPISKLISLPDSNFCNLLEQCNIDDFNDQVIINTALHHNIDIVTHDKDYLKYILTADNSPHIYSLSSLMQ